MTNSKPTYKHIKEIIIQYLKQYQELYGNEIYIGNNESHSEDTNKD